MAQDINIYNNITSGVTEVNGVVPDINGVITIETGDIPESTDANFVSDAELTVIGNTSGTNTGDETDTTIKAKLGITTLSGSNTGDQDLSGYQVTSAKNQPSGYLGITAGNIVSLPNGMGFISLNVTPNQIAYFDAFGNLLTLSTATYPSIAQLAHVKGVTSAIQTQLDAKQNINPSVQTVVSSATVTAISTNDLVEVTAQAAALDIANPTGTFYNGQILNYRIKDNATPRAITFGNKFVGFGSALPTTTTTSKWLLISCQYNSATDKFETLNSLEQ